MSPPGTYFITSVTWGRRSLFFAEPLARLFLQTIYGYRRQSKFRLHAFVLMPEHFHLLLTPTEITLERSVQLIKVDIRTPSNISSGRGLRSGRAVLPTIGSVTYGISNSTANTFIRIL